MKKIIIYFLLILVLALGAYVALDQLGILPDNYNLRTYIYDSEEEQNEQLKNIELKITDNVLGEARETAELIVLEQDICATQIWDKSWGDWGILKKTKTITITGTGYYVVDLSTLNANNIVVDNDKLTVTVDIPQPTLKNVDIDLEKTQFKDTDNGLLRFGEIKATAEQSTIMMAKCEEAMKKELSTDNMNKKALDAANKKVAEIFQPVVSAVNKDYEVVIK